MEVTGSANSGANCFQIQVGILSGAMALKVPRQSSFFWTADAQKGGGCAGDGKEKGGIQDLR